MKRLLSFWTTGVLLASLGVSSAAAQTPTLDDFFDVFSETDIEVKEPDPCDLCEALRMELLAAQDLLQQLQVEMANLEAERASVMQRQADNESDLRKIQKQIDDFKNPKDWIEDSETGQRYDSSDKAAMDMRSANLWHDYKSGSITADQWSEAVGKPLSDPGVQEELQRLKEKIRSDLEAAKESLERQKENLKDQLDEIAQDMDSVKEEMDEISSYIDELLKELEDCMRRCAEEDVNIPKDYQIGQDSQSLWDAFMEWWDNLFNPDPVTPGLEEWFDEMPSDGDGPGDGPSDDTIPPPTAPLGGYEFNLNPPCPECDPIADEIEDLLDIMEAEAAEREALEKQKAQLNADYDNALKLRDNAQKALDSFDNPRSSGESNGNRLDSNDLAALKARNAGLWKSYKKGGMNAEQLSDEWSKSAFDPDVQKELQKIKDKMRSELQDAVNKAQEQMSVINEELSDIGDALAEIAGSLAGKQVLLDYLYDQYDECIAQCREKDATAEAEWRQLIQDLVAELNAIIEEMKKHESSSSAASEGMVEDDDEDGWLCGWLGWFCEEEETDYSSSPWVPSRSQPASSVGSSTASSRSEAKEESEAASVASSRPATGGQMSSVASSKSSVAASKNSSAAPTSCAGTAMQRDTCEETCDGECVSAGAGCYVCREEEEEPEEETPPAEQSCSDVCGGQGYGDQNTDHSDAILSQLQGYTCVSGASVSIQTATIGGCTCIGEYSLSVNQTVPSCKGTPCGDVLCNSSISCETGPDTTTTVTCNWKGWQKVDKNQFRPVIGQ